MKIRAGNALFNSDLWQRALDSYARATNLTVKLFDADACQVFGPIHSTPLFELFETTGYDPGIFAECARQCLAQTKDRPAVIVSEFFGLSAVGTSFLLEDSVVGAAACGYAFVDFAQLSEVERLARNAGIAFDRVWEVALEQKPVPRRRLMLNGELLQVLGDALLRENKRTRQLRALGHRLLTSQEDERRWLAQELHDDTLQRIAALQNDVASVRIRLAPDARDVGKELQDIEEEIGRVSDDIRNLSHRLHPSI